MTTARRPPALPEIPTIAEAGVPGYEFTGWMGVLAPAETAPPVVVKLHRDLSRITHLPEVKSRFAANVADPVDGSPEEFAAYLHSEIVHWTKVVKTAGIRADQHVLLVARRRQYERDFPRENRTRPAPARLTSNVSSKYPLQLLLAR